MRINDVASAIKSRIPMKDVLDFYCLDTKRNFMPCPFHAEKTPSLRVYKNGWYCFGCHSGGSVIDFVMKKENCSFSTAVSAIDHTFNLGLLENHDPRNDDRIVYTWLIDDLADIFLKEVKLVEGDIERSIISKLRLVQDIEGKAVPERTTGEWSELYQLLEEMKYLEYKKELCGEIRREIIEWKNHYRCLSFPVR